MNDTSTANRDYLISEIRQAAFGFVSIIHGNIVHEAIDGFDCDKTAGRITNAWIEMLSGYSQDPCEIIQSCIESHPEIKDIITVKGIKFTSVCEHHFLPFNGYCDIAYMPKNGRIVGLSKLPRLVNCLSRRLQKQELLTAQIADALEKHLKVEGCFVTMEARHSCLSDRGVRDDHAAMQTSEARGVFRTNPTIKHEALMLLRG